jgi:hypothetical protein
VPVQSHQWKSANDGKTLTQEPMFASWAIVSNTKCSTLAVGGCRGRDACFPSGVRLSHPETMHCMPNRLYRSQKRLSTGIAAEDLYRGRGPLPPLYRCRRQKRAHFRAFVVPLAVCAPVTHVYLSYTGVDSAQRCTSLCSIARSCCPPCTTRTGAASLQLATLVHSRMSCHGWHAHITVIAACMQP